MRHPARRYESNSPQLPKISFGIICAIVIALAAPAAYAQRGGGGHFGGAAGHFTRPFGGPRLRSIPRAYGWISSWGPDCFPYSGFDCYGNEYSDTEVEEPAQASVLVIYLRDGSGYGVIDYWIADSVLHFVTTYGSEKSAVFGDVDWQRTVDENATRGIYFKLSSSPSKQRRTATIAPACSASSSEKTGTGSSSPAGGDEAKLFGAAVSATDQGVKVTSVRAGSPAAQVGINPGDVVLRIDCLQVHSGGDIESAIATNTSGTLWVSYLIKGAWLSEQQINVR